MALVMRVGPSRRDYDQFCVLTSFVSRRKKSYMLSYKYSLLVFASVCCRILTLYLTLAARLLGLCSYGRRLRNEGIFHDALGTPSKFGTIHSLEILAAALNEDLLRWNKLGKLYFSSCLLNYIPTEIKSFPPLYNLRENKCNSH